MNNCIKLLLFIPFFLSLNTHGYSKDCPVTVKGHEVYELANIIIAVSPYGQADPNEVNKESSYYLEVLKHFKEFENHPVFAKVNYSRKKWAELLSFRTDSYAFVFNKKGIIKREFKFQSMGEEFNEFEENLALINDFVIVSGFREFYINHSSYYDSIRLKYESTQMIPEILTFLNDEFGEQKTSRYAIVISSLVGAQNLQRTVKKVGTSFVPVPDYILNGTISERDIASSLHMLFTEINHDYINPTTSKNKKIYNDLFDPKKWDSGSGYIEWDHATFNEYMTWAVYDLFIQKHFPLLENDVIINWQLQNQSRKFFASSLFNLKLQELYDNKLENERIADLYPKLLTWCNEVQDNISIPILEKTMISDSIISITFSEPMNLIDHIDGYLIVKDDTITRKQIILEGIQWNDEGTLLSFKSPLIKGVECSLYLNAAWKNKIIVSSKKGINLGTYTKIGSEY
ncbi:MAG: hypothetical protein ACJA1C_001027 [Crocinitomicaceae bacterium]|jgi:hypothetical protein